MHVAYDRTQRAYEIRSYLRRRRSKRDRMRGVDVVHVVVCYVVHAIVFYRSSQRIFILQADRSVVLRLQLIYALLYTTARND